MVSPFIVFEVVLEYSLMGKKNTESEQGELEFPSSSSTIMPQENHRVEES